MHNMHFQRDKHSIRCVITIRELSTESLEAGDCDENVMISSAFVSSLRTAKN